MIRTRPFRSVKRTVKIASPTCPRQSQRGSAWLCARSEKGVKPEVATKVLIQLLDDGSCSGRLFVGERLDYLAGPRLRAVQDMRCPVSPGGRGGGGRGGGG